MELSSAEPIILRLRALRAFRNKIQMVLVRFFRYKFIPASRALSRFLVHAF
jgi:hypothetical protein